MWANSLQQWSKIVRKKNGGRCLYCGSPAEDAHHLFSKKKIPQLALLIANGVPMCESCHKMFPNYRSPEPGEFWLLRKKLKGMYKTVGPVNSQKSERRVIRRPFYSLAPLMLSLIEPSGRPPRTRNYRRKRCPKSTPSRLG